MSDVDRPSRPDRSTTAAVAGATQEKVGQGAELVGNKASEVAGTAREQAGQVASEVATQARDLASELRDQLQDQAHTQTQRLAGSVRRLADDLREMSESGKPDSSAATVMRQIADGGRQVASRLESRGPDGLISDLQDFARRRPGAFLAGAALAGFAVARIGKGVSAAGSGGGRPSGQSASVPQPAQTQGLPAAAPPRVQPGAYGYEQTAVPPSPPAEPPIAGPPYTSYGSPQPPQES